MRSGRTPPLPIRRQEGWAKLRRVGLHRRVRKDAILYLVGDRAGELYLLEEGRVRLFLHSPQRRQLTLSIVEPGHLFGVKALFPRGRHENHAQAISAARICAIPRWQLQEVLAKNPVLALLVMENLGQRVQERERRLGDLVFKSAPGRLATLLLDLAGPPIRGGRSPLRLKNRYTHQQLAEMINMNRETVTRIIGSFRKDDVIDLDRGVVVLLDMKRLRQLASR